MFCFQPKVLALWPPYVDYGDQNQLFQDNLCSQSWFSGVFNDSTTSKEVLTNEWWRQGFATLKAGVFSNDKGNFLRIAELLPDGRSYSLYIPDCLHFFGWKEFKCAVIQHSSVLCHPHSCHRMDHPKQKEPVQTFYASDLLPIPEISTKKDSNSASMVKSAGFCITVKFLLLV